ncbi:MAG: ABC transporter ATP-binding protein [Patescibacteria group bacterium]|jgi:ATP-binding cassette subfamily B protein
MQNQPKKPGIGNLLKPYKGFIASLVILAVASNALNLVTPKLISHAIDSFARGQFALAQTVETFLLIAGLVLVLTFVQGVVQTYASERVARDLRNKLAEKISKQSFLFVQNATPSILLTNLTSDIDGIKLFVSQAIVSLVSSFLLVLGASAILFSIEWKLALAVLAVIPVIGGLFFLTLARVRVLFGEAQKVIDWLNKVISESILASALIRVLNSQKDEYDKFMTANTQAKDIGLKILSMFAGLIPLITFLGNIAVLIILGLGGHYVINGEMTLGDFAAFTSYLAILIFPILIIGFMSNVIARAQASYARISSILDAPDPEPTGDAHAELMGRLEVKNAWLMYGEKPVLKDVSFEVKPGTRVAIIGPTAAGKTQLLYALAGLVVPQAGEVRYDGKTIHEYRPDRLYEQIGLVFQDSVMFNLTIKENIAFGEKVRPDDLERAVKTAELDDFISALPDGLETIVSERGTSLSGGQKQRIMLARALALNPKILFLDDFTARVDALTEQKILDNIEQLYPGITLISVTQKISAIEKYDNIILLMEGEVLAEGTHEHLMEASPEYVQIYESQKSTSHYEVPAQ